MERELPTKTFFYFLDKTIVLVKVIFHDFWQNTISRGRHTFAAHVAQQNTVKINPKKATEYAHTTIYIIIIIYHEATYYYKNRLY